MPLIGAWGLLKQVAEYSGDALRIRRASDSAEADIGWDGSVADAAAIAAHASGSDAHVGALYNQVDANADFGQATAGRQPIVVDSDGGMVFSGSQHLHLGAEQIGDVGLFCGPGQQWTARMWFKIGPDQSGNTILARAGATVANRTFQVYVQGAGNRFGIILRGAESLLSFSQFTPKDGKWHEFVLTWDGADAWQYVDGSPLGANAVGTAAEESGQYIAIGARTVGTGGSAGAVLADCAIGLIELLDVAQGRDEIADAYLAVAALQNATPDVSAVDFDGGLLDLDNSSFDLDGTVILTPRTLLDMQWTNYGAKLTGASGKQPTIQLDTASKWGANEDGMILAWWSDDIDAGTWHRFDNEVWGATQSSFSNDTPFTGDTIYVCRGPHYTQARLEAKLATWTASPHAFNPPSATSYVVGTTTRALNRNSREVPALDIYAVGLTDQSVAGRKNTAILSAAVHPGEPEGRWVFEGAIDYLLGGSDIATTLLKNFVFYLYPNVNASGAYAGYGREFIERSARDINRQWQENGAWPEVSQIIKAATLTDTGSRCQVAIDFHGRYQNVATSGIWSRHAEAKNVEFFTAVNARHTGDMYHTDWTEPTDHAGWRRSALSGLIVNVIAEETTVVTKGIDDYRAFGVALMQGLYDMLQQGEFPDRGGAATSNARRYYLRHR